MVVNHHKREGEPRSRLDARPEQVTVTGAGLDHDRALCAVSPNLRLLGIPFLAVVRPERVVGGPDLAPVAEFRLEFRHHLLRQRGVAARGFHGGRGVDFYFEFREGNIRSHVGSPLPSTSIMVSRAQPPSAERRTLGKRACLEHHGCREFFSSRFSKTSDSKRH